MSRVGTARLLVLLGFGLVLAWCVGFLPLLRNKMGRASP